MERLIINGDPGIRTGAVVEVDGTERVCFSVTRNGDYHGPDRVQLSCVVGDPDEQSAFDTRDYVPHFLEVTALEAEDVTVISPQGPRPS